MFSSKVCLLFVFLLTTVLTAQNSDTLELVKVSFLDKKGNLSCIAIKLSNGIYTSDTVDIARCRECIERKNELIHGNYSVDYKELEYSWGKDYQVGPIYNTLTGKKLYCMQEMKFPVVPIFEWIGDNYFSIEFIKNLYVYDLQNDTLIRNFTDSKELRADDYCWLPEINQLAVLKYHASIKKTTVAFLKAICGHPDWLSDYQLDLTMLDGTITYSVPIAKKVNESDLKFVKICR